MFWLRCINWGKSSKWGSDRMLKFGKSKIIQCWQILSHSISLLPMPLYNSSLHFYSFKLLLIQSFHLFTYTGCNGTWLQKPSTKQVKADNLAFNQKKESVPNSTNRFTTYSVSKLPQFTTKITQTEKSNNQVQPNSNQLKSVQFQKTHCTVHVKLICQHIEAIWQIRCNRSSFFHQNYEICPANLKVLNAKNS